MDDDESLFTGSEAASALPPVPDDVWARALAAALDPAAPAVDADLVPEMDDEPVVPEEDGIVLVDDESDPDDDDTAEVVLDDGDSVFDELTALDIDDVGVSGEDPASAFDPQEPDLHHHIVDPDPGYDLL
ncbi:hypothetical protein [Rhodococcus tukisamuensis]|uniref:Uncharacterized protein n=1 Tax=Rhodococcus tukisamuensis TaxID=168276 RepID=A0A1G7B9A5_9NOCA|nr:hypothetical protein [Rhodococcus tukisamuensis]SDE22825.1 hypothetical protein SAMN05444580_112104 [Rhodococcus tukisamuensis]